MKNEVELTKEEQQSSQFSFAEGGDLRDRILPEFTDFNPLTTDYENKDVIVSPGQVNERLDINLNSTKGSGGAYINRLITFTDTDATPSVKNANMCITTGTTAITDFDDGIIGQIIHIKATGNITITNGTPIKLAGAGNFAMTADDTLTLGMFDDQVWHELARSVN